MAMINLNMTENYAPSFNEGNNWPVAREIISNAIDASPDGDFFALQSGDKLEVRTKSSPTLEQLLVLGEGSKKPSGETIGQFGEGLKVAANAVCRGGGKMVVELPGHTVRYCYRKPSGFEVPTLHAEVRKASNAPGCVISVTLDKVGTHADKIMKDRKKNLIPRTGSEQMMRLHHKGIWVADIDMTSMFHWNLWDGNINRDRGVVDMSDIRYHAAQLLLANMTQEIAEELLSHPDKCQFEIDVLRYASTWMVQPCHRHLFSEAFLRKNGSNAVLATEDMRDNRSAEYEGHKVVQAPDGIREMLIGDGSRIKKSRDVIPNSNHLEFVEIDPSWSSRIAALSRIAELLNIPGFVLKVFKQDNKHLGFYHRREDGVSIFLSNHLFIDGGEVLLFGSFLHELAHHTSDGAQDRTVNMEVAMAELSGRLAHKLIRAEDRLKKGEYLSALDEIEA